MENDKVKEKPKMYTATFTVDEFKDNFLPSFYRNTGRFPKFNNFMDRNFYMIWNSGFIVWIRKKLKIWSLEDELANELVEEIRAEIDSDLINKINEKAKD